MVEELCLGCDECINACPVSVPHTSAYTHGLEERKAIYVPFPGSVPNCAVIDPQACLRSKGEACTLCADACPLEAVDFQQRDRQHEVTAGAVVLATGFTSYSPGGDPRWGSGELPEVYTLSQLERLASNHGPTKGKIVKRDGAAPGRVAIIHCVGRQELGYCSGVCCQAALKVGLLAAGEKGQVEVVHLHSDHAALSRTPAGASSRAGQRDPA